MPLSQNGKRGSDRGRTSARRARGELSRGVVTPVKTVAVAVRRVAEARSAAAAGRVPVYTLDEMGDLSDAVNSMVTRLKEADAQIREQVRELRALDELKDQFLRVAAHELKTPITIIKGYSQLLLRRADSLPSDVTPLLGAMNRGTDRITHLVENFLSMTQLQTGRVPFVLTTFDLAELVKTIVTTTSGKAPDQPINVESEPSVWVNGDRARLERAVDAVVSNAVKFSPGHGEIRVLVEKEGDEAVVKVKDHGIGIPVDKQSRIFESFYRAHTDTPYDSGGMGVGLYLARETLLRHNGAIGFVSQEGKGSHFVLRLPLSNAPSASEPIAN
ncbi:multi-sensor signal transduction histidine kinase [Labilithrix luteola]|uniref:histidine kinase n=1 Tax=Labilithrix luteola TaxID=1391654 RepID=A0A0K1PVG9_9BACT|nr:HAMP domain-containing sensor histidine kinase [Labilithrix luteola]AKU97528.1 multi-sensor signal transduction histidine kinase [Labilithrix luteola]